MLWGQAPQNMPYMISKQKIFQKKITSPKNEKFYVSIFDLKTIQIVLITAQGSGKWFLSPKNGFKIFRFSNLEKIQKFFKKKRSKIEKFLSKFSKNFYFFRCFFSLGASLTTWLTAWASQNTKI